MNLFYPSGNVLRKDGICLSPDNSPLRQISFSTLILEKGVETEICENDNETAVIILSGELSVSGSEISANTLGERDSVFEGKASALYLPPGAQVSITASEAAELAIAQSPSSKRDLRPKVIKPGEVVIKSVGKNNWSRSVNVIMGPDFPADRMVIGETCNPPGNWSSSPPHKHDEHDPPHESLHEELYYYRVWPVQGFGIQRIYTEDGMIDECHTVRDGDVVIIPRGYHPVVAGPGYQLYYLWILAGPERQTAWREDKKHNWIHDS
jgi:5-deoxy-glucuronate isomerase